MNKMSDRKLASVQKIISIDPIPDADKIEKATILGWEVVVAKKDNFKVGNLAVYIEVDSVLPDCAEFEFLRDRKFRIKTIKLKKQISQGLVLPLSVLPDCHYYKEGEDVTAILKIKKYDPEGDLE
jgi:RNA ligase (TIGR02306 family)